MKKSSMTNYVRITLIRARILSDISIPSYNFKIEFGKQVSESDKISGKDSEIGKVK